MATPDPSTIYRDALIAAREESADALLAFADAFVATARDRTLDPTTRDLANDRLRAVRSELQRREQLSRIALGVASPADRTYAAWRELAALVRERADMLRVFDLCGYHVVHRQGAREAHAACPACKDGTDRLVITAGPPDLCWCRQCRWGGDVITVARSLRQLGFRDAVAWLAELCGERLAAA
jgi:hypothetical protein